MSETQVFYGETLREKDTDNKTLIEGVLWQGDTIMLLGSEKAGKSILAMQMACSLTSGSPFLDKYHVPEKVPILYLQAEGKRSDFIDRLNCMENALPCDDTLFYHISTKFFPLDIQEFREKLIAIIAQLPVIPKVLFLDALYVVMAGDLVENEDTRGFIASISQVTQKFDLTTVIVHHDRKEDFDRDTHQEVQRGDKGSYGSVFLRAWVDHILYLKKNKDKTRNLTCDTQRSGRVMEKEELILVEPNPLCFEIKGDYTSSEEMIYYRLKARKGSIADELVGEGLSKSSVHRGLRHLYQGKKIKKEGKFWSVIDIEVCQK